MKLMRRHVLALGLSAAAALSACGGGGSETSTRQTITSVYVFGDSLADVGYVGSTPRPKSTVQSSESFVYPELIAQAFGVSALCSVYAGVYPGFTPNAAAGCTGYAVSGGRINNPALPGSPRSIRQQMANASSNNYAGGSLVVIDGGGNDAADLIGALLAFSAAPTTDTNFRLLLSSLLPPADVAAALSTPTGPASIGGRYMVALADAFHQSIVDNVLNRGASRVAILNMPAIDKTPRFQGVLAAIEASSGAAARVQANTVLTTWLQVFNSRLEALFATDSRVAIVDFYQGFEDQFADPAQFALTNVTRPVCPQVGNSGPPFNLPVYSAATCTVAAVQANAPAGVTDPNYWQSYAFADDFHPTPYAHRLIYQLIARSLAQKGWL